MFMRIRNLFTAVGLLLVSTSFAQFDLGLKAGLNVTKIDGQSFKDQFKYGYHLGGFAAFGLGDKFGLQPEVLYNQNTLRVDSSYTNAVNIFQNGLTDVKLNYISIPILFRMAAMRSKRVISPCWAVCKLNWVRFASTVDM